jgi:hypothetical protein
MLVPVGDFHQYSSYLLILRYKPGKDCQLGTPSSGKFSSLVILMTLMTQN